MNVPHQTQVHDYASIRRRIARQIESLCDSLCITRTTAIDAILRAKWNEENATSQVLQCAESANDRGPPRRAVYLEDACCICYADYGPSTRPVSIYGCGHRFCFECMQGLLNNKMGDASEMLTCRCPVCPQPVGIDDVEAILGAAGVDRYYRMLVDSYVSQRKNLRFCTRPGCTYILQAHCEALSAQCKCAQVICFRCGMDQHLPAPCKLVRTWLEREMADGATVSWMARNTKKCPFCSSTIEKNSGCNQMRCRDCNGVFCWLCLGDWATHTDHFQCNKFTDLKVKHGSDTRQMHGDTNHSSDVVTYAFYFERYENHKQSVQLIRGWLPKLEERRQQCIEHAQQNYPERFFEFPVRVLLDCRQALHWTYAMAHSFRNANETLKLGMLEMMQWWLTVTQTGFEHAVELLMELMERKADAITSHHAYRVQCVDLANRLSAYLDSLLQSFCGVRYDTKVVLTDDLG